MRSLGVVVVKWGRRQRGDERCGEVGGCKAAGDVGLGRGVGEGGLEDLADSGLELGGGGGLLEELEGVRGEVRFGGDGG